MNSGTVTLEYVCVISEDKGKLTETPGHSVYSGSQLT